MNKSGLYNKYKVTHTDSGKQLEGQCFVLRPDRDPAAVEALKAYAKTTENKQLAEGIEYWLIYLGIQRG
ncbi:hypothetical protein ACTFSJ_27585 [Bacillus cereus group sp. MYBK12-2]|uniref:hypothetical protein n=1 Tax=Bacillus cereus group sp. MYBK12-2 TaxID=3450689 RepID=UPI0032FBD94A|nr:hypothetical protein [Bacillus pacificus]HDR7653561.1 hypothetical protein [Bacillus pacificus]